MSTGHTLDPEVYLPAQATRGRSQRNVGDTERMISLAAGGLLALYGVARGRAPGLIALALGGGLIYRGATGHCPAFQRLGLDTSRSKNPAIGVRAQHGVKIEKAITINCPREDLYRFWRNVENLPAVMDHLVAVRETDPKRAHWVARGPLGAEVEWDSEIINERENELLAWRSIPGGDVDTAGSIHFEKAPHERGTIVKITLKYDPPGGKAGVTIAKLLGDGLERQLHNDLQRFKQLMEAGELATTEGQPRGYARR